MSRLRTSRRRGAGWWVALAAVCLWGGVGCGSSSGTKLAERVCDCYEDAQRDRAKRKACGRIAMVGQAELQRARDEMGKYLSGLVRCKDLLGPD